VTAPELVRLHEVSDLVILASYLVIAAIMVGWLRRRHDRSLGHIFWLFGGFIAACVSTLLMGFLVFLYPVQALEGYVKVVCAFVSALTAALLVPLMPRIMRLPRLSELYRLNVELRGEVLEQQRRLDKLGIGTQAELEERLRRAIASVRGEAP
jgi:hypothetical protein